MSYFVLFSQVFWSDSGQLVCIASDDSFYILKYDGQAVQHAVANNVGIDDDGIEAAFDVSINNCKCIVAV